MAVLGRPFLVFHLIWSTLAFTLISGCAAALNHLLEKDIDQKMERTKNRPLPSAELMPFQVLLFAMILLFFGGVMLILSRQFELLLGCLGMLLLYDFVYTPLKRVSWLNTFVGAIPGAMPPLCGWISVSTSFSWPIWVLFAVLFLWQLPHFFAIAWMYQDSYRSANLKMLPGIDPTGIWSAILIIFFTLVLVFVAGLLFFVPYLGWLVGGLNIGAGLWFLWTGIRFYLDRGFTTARGVLRGSIIYQMLLFLGICLDFWI